MKTALLAHRFLYMNAIKRKLEQVLNKLQTLADKNGFKFSQGKTHVNHFCNQRKLHWYSSLLRSMASSLFNPCVWQSFFTISVQVFFGLLLGLAPSTSYSIHFFTQSLSSFRNTCPYHRNLFHCSTEIMPSNLSLSLNPLLGILSCSFMPLIHLTILIPAHWGATSFSFLTGQASLPCNILLNCGCGKHASRVYVVMKTTKQRVYASFWPTAFLDHKVYFM